MSNGGHKSGGRLAPLYARPVLAVLGIAFAVRALAALVIYVVEGGSLFPDDESYSQIASEKASGASAQWDDYIEYVWERTTLLLGPVSVLYRLTGEFELAGQLYVAAAGAMTAALTTWVALRFLSRGWAIAAGLLVALLPSQVLWSSVILKDPLVAVLMVGIAACVYCVNRSEAWGPALIWLGAVALLLTALADTRRQSFAVAIWCVVFATIFGGRRIAHVVPAVLVALLLPLAVTDYGLGGKEARSGFSALEDQRSRAAVDADSAVVDPPPRGGGGDDSSGGSGSGGRGDSSAGSGSGGGDDSSAGSGSDDQPDTPDPGADSLADHLRYLPTGIQAYLLRPYPWEADSASFGLRVASIENLLWYGLIALAGIGLLGGAWRHRDALAFPVAILGGTILLYSLSEGNLGTAFRHRSEVLWPIALLAILGLKLIVGWRRGPESIRDGAADSTNGRPHARRGLERT